jgi:hypothetical protein
MSRPPRPDRPGAPPTYRGGGTYRSRFGYVHEKSPGHHRANSQGYVLQHILVAEDALGRPIRRPEVVHHENHIRDDNRPENLRVFPNARAHLDHHEKEWEASGQHPSRAPLTEESVRKALRGRSTLQAADLLGVNHQTLRNRFPHLLSKRPSPGFLDGRKAEIRKRAMTEPMGKLAASLGCPRGSLIRMLVRWRREDGLPDEPVSLRDAQKRRKRAQERTASDTAPTRG